jgi:hypothetical protein
MVATYHVEPSKTNDFLQLFQRLYSNVSATVTVDAPVRENPVYAGGNLAYLRRAKTAEMQGQFRPHELIED